MHKNYLWQAFLVVIFAATLWYTSHAIFDYYSYSHLKVQTPLSTLDWEIVEKTEEDYLVKGVYNFEFNDKSFPGTTTFTSTPYRNHWAAEQSIKDFSDTYRTVWFDPQNPNHSSMEKSFPFKEIISAIFLWGLTIYFLWLGFYVTKFKT